ncbi:MAG: tRNA lysidine(34) synthetase TilS [Armatimonadetes bacterium]|nr:tRNA lysidine(34) synthetase TilS [Armatimonadota bacterium]
MQEQFQRHLFESGLLAPDAKILVGYSGGADSTCLLHLLKISGYEVIAAHLHHGQRPEADKEMKLCEAFCQEHDIPFVSGKADVPRMATDLRMGIEEAGRMARYNFLEQAARRLECDVVATAHTRSDHVETILFNLARGTGPQGLTGIPARRGNIVRPLLSFGRKETTAYCEAQGFWYHNDPGNDNLDFSRVRIRQRVTPEFAVLNPRYEEAMARCASILDEEDRFLNGAAAAALEQSEVVMNGELAFLTRDVEIAFSKAHLTSLPAVLFKRAARLAFQSLGAPIDYDQTELLAEEIRSERGSLTADGGEVVCEWDGEKVHFRVLRPTEPFRFGITCPGETESEEFGWKIMAIERPSASLPVQRAALHVQIPKSQIRGDLYFRSTQQGDSMQPLGFEGTRKVSDLLSEAKLTAAARVRLPLICDFLGPIWLPGVCLSHRMYRGDDCSTVVELKFEPIQ